MYSSNSAISFKETSQNYSQSSPGALRNSHMVQHPLPLRLSNMGSGSEGLYRPTASVEHGVGNEKVTMQNLNDRLAYFLERVRTLEQANSKLELQINEVLEKRSPELHDYSRYEAILTQLHNEILQIVLGNTHMAIQIENGSLAVEDIKVKIDYERQIRLSTESENHNIRKTLDSTNVEQLHLENDVETLNDQLSSLKKNHQQEVKELQNKLAQSGVQVDINAPKAQDLVQIMEEMRAKYEKITLKNEEELETQHEQKIIEVDTAELMGARNQVRNNRSMMQSLEIKLQARTGLNASLKGSLEETQLQYNMQVEQYNAIILQLEAKLRELRSAIQKQMQDYTILLNLNGELEAEIDTYTRYLDELAVY
ncbi:hypothetical protein NFI96_010631 [Prochilodus magdalenae]|nr:hypothetical protein NFI96_010631 [Prochilodus magdalenae]